MTRPILAITMTLSGVGEAFDPDEPNASALVEAHSFTLGLIVNGYGGTIK